jgi:hypothetical protein
MTTSGTYAFNPSLGEMVMYAYNAAGVRGTSLSQSHMSSARMAVNLMLARWSNQGVNLWAVDLIEVPLIEGQTTYDVDPSTVMVLDAYIQTDNGGGEPIDRTILPVSRSEYASYPNKQQQGFPTIFWFDRLISPTITLWPVPPASGTYTLKYYRVRQIQDANLTNGQNVEIPYRWLEAFADGLAYRLAKIWNPQMAAPLKAVADESYDIAAFQDTENVNMYISPQLSGYYR